MILIVLPIIISGYFIFKIHPVLSLKLHRYEGQHLYIGAIFYGSIITILSALLISIIDSYLSPVNVAGTTIDAESFIKTLFSSFNTSYVNEITDVFFILVASIFIAYSWSKLTYYLYKLKVEQALEEQNIESSLPVDKQIKIQIMKSILIDSPMDDLLLSSYVSGNLLMLSMEDRKVYVGRVMSLGEPTENEGADQEISIIPVYSGYRNKDTLKLTIDIGDNSTTNYQQFNDDIYLTLRQENILSATIFDQKAYEDLNPLQTKITGGTCN